MAGFTAESAFRGVISSSSATGLAGALEGMDFWGVFLAGLAAVFLADLPAGFLAAGFFFGAGLDALTTGRFFTAFFTAAFFVTTFLATAFFFGNDTAFFVLDDAFATAFFFLFAIPILLFVSARRNGLHLA